MAQQQWTSPPAMQIDVGKNYQVSIETNRGLDVTVSCAAGEKAVSGGFTSQQFVLGSDTHPSGDGASWQLYLIHPDTGTASGTSYAVCVK